MDKLRLLALMMGVLVWACPSWGQDYDPMSPDEPGIPLARLQLQVEPAEGGSAHGGGSYLPGSEVSLEAWPERGYVFVNWTDASGAVVSTDASMTLVKAPGKEVLTAHFEFRPQGPDEPAPGIEQLLYPLTLNATEGGRASGAGRYCADSQVVLSATTDTGYRFVRWSDDDGTVLSTDAYYVYTTQAEAHTITAVFTFDPDSPAEPADPVLSHRIHVICSEGGWCRYPTERVLQGTTSYLSAYPNEGYDFDGWYVDGQLYSSDWALAYVMQNHDITFEARFVFAPYSPDEPMSPSERMSFYLMSVVSDPGSMVEYPMYFTTLDTVGDIRFDLSFPPEAVPDWSTLTIDPVAAGYVVSIEEGSEEGNVSVTLSGSTLSPCTVPLLSVMAQVPETATYGSYPVKINQVSITQLDGERVTARTRNGRVYVYYLGDANGDGVVSVTDITDLVAYIMEEEVPGFIFEVADVNKDGVISVYDITLTIDIIMQAY